MHRTGGLGPLPAPARYAGSTAFADVRLRQRGPSPFGTPRCCSSAPRSRHSSQPRTSLRWTRRICKTCCANSTSTRARTRRAASHPGNTSRPRRRCHGPRASRRNRRKSRSRVGRNRPRPHPLRQNRTRSRPIFWKMRRRRPPQGQKPAGRHHHNRKANPANLKRLPAHNRKAKRAFLWGMAAAGRTAVTLTPPR